MKLEWKGKVLDTTATLLVDGLPKYKVVKDGHGENAVWRLHHADDNGPVLSNARAHIRHTVRRDNPAAARNAAERLAKGLEVLP